MKDLKLISYYEKQLNNKKTRDQAQKFLSSLPETEEDIEYEYEEEYDEGGYYDTLY